MRLIYIIILSCVALISCNRISDDEIIDAALAIEYKDIDEDEWLFYYVPQQSVKELKKEYVRIAKTSPEVMWIATQASKENVSAKQLLKMVIADIECNERLHYAVLCDFEEFLYSYRGIEYKSFTPKLKNIASKDYYKQGLDYPNFVYDIPSVKRKISDFQMANKRNFDDFLKWTFINEIDSAYREDYVLEYLNRNQIENETSEWKSNKHTGIDYEAIDRFMEEKERERRREKHTSFQKFYKVIREHTYDMIIEE